jgi:hypothetical protein
MRADGQRSAFVAGGHDTEQQLGAGVIQRCKADLIDEQEIGPEKGVNDLADGVVGQPAVKRLDEVGTVLPGQNRSLTPSTCWR